MYGKLFNLTPSISTETTSELQAEHYRKLTGAITYWHRPPIRALLLPLPSPNQTALRALPVMLRI